MNLLSKASGNTKIRKSQGEAQEYRLAYLALAPVDESGFNVCPHSTPGCRAGCVGTIGLASVFGQIMEQRRKKTRYFFEHRAEAIAQLCEEIEREHRSAEREGTQLAIRLNTFSDIPWEVKAWGEIPQRFPNVQFYDYSKLYNRRTPENYAICYSWTEEPADQASCHSLLLDGFNVAIAFGKAGTGLTGPRAYLQQLPKRWKIGSDWFEVYDGDQTDLRFLDPGRTRSGRGRICGLRFKSSNNATRDAVISSGFVEIV